jgi:hypothetical protein
MGTGGTPANAGAASATDIAAATTAETDLTVCRWLITLGATEIPKSASSER